MSREKDKNNELWVGSELQLKLIPALLSIDLVPKDKRDIQAFQYQMNLGMEKSQKNESIIGKGSSIIPNLQHGERHARLRLTSRKCLSQWQIRMATLLKTTVTVQVNHVFEGISTLKVVEVYP